MAVPFYLACIFHFVLLVCSTTFNNSNTHSRYFLTRASQNMMRLYLPWRLYMTNWIPSVDSPSRPTTKKEPPSSFRRSRANGSYRQQDRDDTDSAHSDWFLWTTFDDTTHRLNNADDSIDDDIADIDSFSSLSDVEEQVNDEHTDDSHSPPLSSPTKRHRMLGTPAISSGRLVGEHSGAPL